MSDKGDRIRACRGDKVQINMGPVCDLCRGSGEIWKPKKKLLLTSNKRMVVCELCMGVGRDTIPWSEIMMGGKS